MVERREKMANTILVLAVGSPVTIDRNLKVRDEDNFVVSESMVALKGEKTTIREVCVDADGIWYRLNIDHGKWWWDEKCFEKTN